jgi:hypothetical protein
MGPPLGAGRTAFEAIAWRPDGNRLATAGRDGCVRIWEPDTGRALGERQISQTAVPGVTFSPDGTRLILTDDRVLQYDADSLHQVADLIRLPGHPARRPTVSPDGRTVVALDAAPDAAAPPAIGMIDLHDARATDLAIDVVGVAAAYSPDGQRLAVAGNRGEVVLIDVRSGAPIHPPTIGHDGPAGPITFSADGRTVVAGGPDGRVTIWDGHTGELLGAVAPATADVRTYPAFLPDGHTVVIVASDGTVHTWDSRPDRWVAFTCRIVRRDLSPAERTLALGDRMVPRAC